MKGLLIFKPILKDIVVHATPDEFGQIMLISRNILEWFIHNEYKVLMHLKKAINDDDDFKDIRYQTKKICSRAIQSDAFNLRYVKNQTEDICFEAIICDGLALQFVKEQTENMCLEAVLYEGNALQFVKEQTEDICLSALGDNIEAIQFVKDKTEDIREYVSAVIKKLKRWNK
jgi:hypothetical protein